MATRAFHRSGAVFFMTPLTEFVEGILRLRGFLILSPVAIRAQASAWFFPSGRIVSVMAGGAGDSIPILRGMLLHVKKDIPRGALKPDSYRFFRLPLRKGRITYDAQYEAYDCDI